MPMQPRPSAETHSPCPSMRACIRGLLGTGTDLDHAVAHTSLVTRLGHARRAAHDRSVGEAERAAVPRTLHAPVDDRSLVQRAAGMGARRRHREQLAGRLVEKYPDTVRLATAQRSLLQFGV